MYKLKKNTVQHIITLPRNVLKNAELWIYCWIFHEYMNMKDLNIYLWHDTIKNVDF